MCAPLHCMATLAEEQHVRKEAGSRAESLCSNLRLVVRPFRTGYLLIDRRYAMVL